MATSFGRERSGTVGREATLSGRGRSVGKAPYVIGAIRPPTTDQQEQERGREDDWREHPDGMHETSTSSGTATNCIDTATRLGGSFPGKGPERSQGKPYLARQSSAVQKQKRKSQ